MSVLSVPAKLIESMADLRFPPHLNARIQVLMDRSNDGALTPAEQGELAELAELSETMSLARAFALHTLGRQPA
jgi:hypothetical protein